MQQPSTALIDDVRIQTIETIPTPCFVCGELPVSDSLVQQIFQIRQQVERCILRQDDRLVVVVGPCSIHDPEAALEYAHKLYTQSQRLSSDLLIIMRVYFEKPRTIVGWKGLINDPHLDGSFAIHEGILLARRLLLEINQIGLGTGAEFLDMITPQYIADLVAWGAIGARTTESQIHRQLASGLSCPVGFKNGTEGNVKVAVDAICAAQSSHHFLSVTKSGCAAVVATQGNQACHIILRGGTSGPNYSPGHVESSVEALQKAGVSSGVMVDCSHANCSKQFKRQIEVADSLAQQLIDGQSNLIGVMVESNLEEGRQDLKPSAPLKYGCSITDPCLGWADTVQVLECLAHGVQARRKGKN